jgi:hypothetical protein
MATGITTNYNLPYPRSTDPVNVSGDIEQLAIKIDNDLQEIIEDTSSLMWTTGGTFSNGLLAPTYNDTTGKMSMSLSQNLQTSASPTFAAITTSGNAAINGGVITTSATTATVFNATATTLNIGQAATTISVGATTGTITLRNPTVVSAATSLTLFNTDSTTINFGGAATTFNIGASTGAATMNLSNGATTNGTTKTVNIGGSGVNGSITNINLGSSVSGALGTLTINSPTVSIPSTAISLGTITSGIWNGTEIAVNRGGTGLTSYVVGDIVYASASATLTRLAGVATGNALISGGVGAAPSWGKIGLTTHISGTLPVANGGTGVTTSTGTENVVLSNSPTLTGSPISTTASVDTNTTQIATTAFVIGQASSTNPTMNGSVAIGSSLRYARSDHVHPIDTSRAPVASPTFTGTVSSEGTQILMSSSASGSPTQDVFFTVKRGSSPDVALRWNEAGDTWQFTNDGTNYIDIGSGGGSGSADEIIGITFFTMGA